jgi:hypothetical protein
MSCAWVIFINEKYEDYYHLLSVTMHPEEAGESTAFRNAGNFLQDFTKYKNYSV